MLSPASRKPTVAISISRARPTSKATQTSPACFATRLKAGLAYAHGHLDFLKEVGDPVTGEPIGGTPMNLKAAIASETYEYTEMYPGFARTAREEGFEEVAEWFEALACAEKSHAGRFQKGLNSIG